MRAHDNKKLAEYRFLQMLVEQDERELERTRAKINALRAAWLKQTEARLAANKARLEQLSATVYE